MRPADPRVTFGGMSTRMGVRRSRVEKILSMDLHNPSLNSPRPSVRSGLDKTLLLSILYGPQFSEFNGPVTPVKWAFLVLASVFGHDWLTECSG